MLAAGDARDMKKKKKQSCRCGDGMEQLQRVCDSRRLREALQAERRCLTERVGDLEERKTYLSYHNKHDDLWLLQAQKESEDMNAELQARREKKRMLEEENRTFADQNHNTETILQEVRAENRKLLAELQDLRERDRVLHQESRELADEVEELQAPADPGCPPRPQVLEEEPDENNRKLQLQLQEAQKLLVHRGKSMSLLHRDIAFNLQIIEEYRQSVKHLRKTVQDLREQLENKHKEDDDGPNCAQHDNTKSLFDELQEEVEVDEDPPGVLMSQHLDHGWFLKEKSPDVEPSLVKEPWWRFYGNWFMTINRYVGRAALRFFYVSSA